LSWQLTNLFAWYIFCRNLQLEILFPSIPREAFNFPLTTPVVAHLVAQNPNQFNQSKFSQAVLSPRFSQLVANG
jgi:hypothetical protein